MAAVAFTGNSASTANATGSPAIQVAGRGTKHPIYRRGMFRRGSRWTAGSTQLVVRARRHIRSVNGGHVFTRNAFEVVFRQTSGRPLGQGLVTLTSKNKPAIPLFLTEVRPGVYGAVINRQEHTA